MRFVWGSLVGLLLCGTIVYAGISSEDLEDGVLASSMDDILSLLRSEQLMRAGEEGKCEDSEVEDCRQSGKSCTPVPEAHPKYACIDCLDRFVKDGNDCVPKTCDNFGNEDCNSRNQTCRDEEEKVLCEDCAKDDIFDKDTKLCVKKTCENFGNEDCNSKNQTCRDEEEKVLCEDCAKDDIFDKDTKLCVKKCDCGEAKCSFDEKGGKVCTCLENKKAFYNQKCLDCDCGDTDKCELDDKGKKKKCECKPKQEIYKEICKSCDCGEISCKFKNNGDKECYCPKKTTLFKDNCVDCDCGVLDDCKVDGDGKKQECNCKSKKLKLHDEKCVDTCESKGTVECKKYFKKCVNKDDGYVCDACLENYKDDNGKCKKKCNDKYTCKNDGKCENDICKCKKGYDGDFCENIPKCTDEIKNICKNAKAVCVYSSTEDKGVCECADKNFVFKEDSCKTHKWCDPNPCSTNECSVKDGVGYCKCADKHYFDYNAKLCKPINLCLSKSCGSNEECNPNDGKCKCIDGFGREKDEEPCKANACKRDPSPCFSDATCQETKVPNVVKCTCENPKFYDGNVCENGECFLTNKNCAECPEDTTKNDKGECEIAKDKSCKKNDCGFGLCIKEGDKEKCVCFETDFTEEKDGKCILSANACASGKLQQDGMKCKCDGIYKMSSNGITCERKTCEDKEVKDECEKQKAKCVTLWTGDRSHSCECDSGYMHHPDDSKVCITPCEHPDAVKACSGDQTCYLTNDKKTHDCKCLPSFKSNGRVCEPTSTGVDFLIKGLSVKNAKYLKEGKIDEVKLSKDINDAMKATYLENELEFALLYNYKKSGESVICDVWLQFKENGKGNADRWKAQVQSDVLPPTLQLSNQEWKNLKAEETKFCSEEIKTNICGQHTKCENNKCSCKSDGYKEIKSSVRIQGDFKYLFCEDIDECNESTHKCSTNTTCINTAGDYFCKCNDGFKKVSGSTKADDKESCTDLCTPNPCKEGTCSLEKNVMDCVCNAGFGGSLCDREDENFKRASKNTVVVGAVLGTILGVVVILLAFYIQRQRKNSYSEDFTPPPRMDNAEMVERGRPMRGVNNRGYQN